MNIIEEIKNILKHHECQCYQVDEKHHKLTYIGLPNTCGTLHPAIAEITGFLILNKINYEMTEDNDIILKLLDSVLINPRNGEKEITQSIP